MNESRNYHCQSLKCQQRRNGKQHRLTEKTVHWITYKLRMLPVCKDAFDRWQEIPVKTPERVSARAHKRPLRLTMEVVFPPSCNHSK